MGLPIMPQALYIPDLAPYDFWLFPGLKIHLRGQHFTTNQQVVTACQGYFDSNPENEFFLICEEWKKPWDACIAAKGSYFEWENCNLDD